MGSALEDVTTLRDRYAGAGQEHVFRFWDRLDGPSRERLAAQAARLDLAALDAARTGLEASEAPPERLEPAPVERLPERGGDATLRARARACGEDWIARGAVAPVVLAGGQGTRLGFPGPKGAYPLGPLSERSLFEILAQKVRGARRRHGAALPWCVMTSEPTDAAVRRFFERQAFFGLPPEDVLFFEQASTPALGRDGRLLLEAPDRIASCPGGHGGVIPALVESGVLDALEARGVRFLTTFQVDNPLVRVVDPVFVGLHALRGAELSCKALAKGAPGERAGTLALRDGGLRVIEYTEIHPEHRDARDADGELRFWAASIGMHVLGVGFVRRVAARAAEILPFHLALKTIPCLAEDGSPMQPAEPNGYKLERFVFDALAAAGTTACLEVRREEEYSPVKRPEGPESPATARRDLLACYRRWLAAAGRPGSGDFELDHAWIDGPEDAREFVPPTDETGTATGVTA